MLTIMADFLGAIGSGTGILLAAARQISRYGGMERPHYDRLESTLRVLTNAPVTPTGAESSKQTWEAVEQLTVSTVT